MARMPSKRWRDMIPGNEQMDKDDFRACLIPASEAATLLSRQHDKFVRLVKELPRYDENKDYHENQQYLGLFNDGRFIKLDDLLAALQQGGKK